MRLIPLSELPKFEVDETIPALKGRIKNLFKPISGTGEFGDWKLQNLTITAIAPDTGEIKVLLKDRDDVPMNMKGKIIYIECSTGDRGMTGVKWKANKKKKEEREVSVTGTATVTFPEVAGTQPEATPPPAQAEKPPTAPDQKPATPPPATGTPGAARNPTGKSAKIEVLKKAHLMHICISASKYALGKIAEETGKKVESMPFETIISVATTLYIDAHRDGLHVDLPYTIPDPPKPQTPPQQQ